jgi:hypothetical protein
MDIGHCWQSFGYGTVVFGTGGAARHGTPVHALPDQEIGEFGELLTQRISTQVAGTSGWLVSELYTKPQKPHVAGQVLSSLRLVG